MRLSTFRNTPTPSGNAPVWSPVARPAGLKLPPDRSAISTAQIGDLGLKVGEAARLFPAGNADFAFEVHLVGWIGRESLLVTQPSWRGRPMAMNAGDACRLRLFHGRRAISFVTTVLGMHDMPSPCLALAYPAQINICEVRAEPRVATFIEARAGEQGGPQSRPCRLRDMSLRGLRLQADAPVAPPGGRIVARFVLEVAGETREFALPGEVRNLAATGGSDEAGWDHGVELDPVPATEAGWLTAYLESRHLDS